MIKEFLMKICDEILDEFENPLFESTCKVYYLLKSLRLMDLTLSKEKIKELIKLKKNLNTEVILKELETSHLVIILKMFNMLDVGENVEKEIIKGIKRGIQNRITENGIIHDREGLFSSEATYYILFFYFINHKLEELDHINILDDIIFRIYRNLELIGFSEDTSHDLFSEIFYSCESLKLINCVDCKEMNVKMGKHLFPKKVINKIMEAKVFSFDKAHFRHYTVDEITGEIHK
jgi:hypothetical protein